MTLKNENGNNPSTPKQPTNNTNHAIHTLQKYAKKITHPNLTQMPTWAKTTIIGISALSIAQLISCTPEQEKNTHNPTIQPTPETTQNNPPTIFETPNYFSPIENTINTNSTTTTNAGTPTPEEVVALEHATQTLPPELEQTPTPFPTPTPISFNINDFINNITPKYEGMIKTIIDNAFYGTTGLIPDELTAKGALKIEIRNRPDRIAAGFLGESVPIIDEKLDKLVGWETYLNRTDLPLDDALMVLLHGLGGYYSSVYVQDRLPDSTLVTEDFVEMNRMFAQSMFTQYLEEQYGYITDMPNTPENRAILANAPLGWKNNLEKYPVSVELHAIMPGWYEVQQNPDWSAEVTANGKLSVHTLKEQVLPYLQTLDPATYNTSVLFDDSTADLASRVLETRVSEQSERTRFLEGIAHP